MDEYLWTEDASAVDFGELPELYRIAPLGTKPPDALRTVFGHSMFVCFAYAGDVLAGAGRPRAGQAGARARIRQGGCHIHVAGAAGV